MKIDLLANTPNGNVNPHLHIIVISIRLNIKGGFEREIPAHIKGKPFCLDIVATAKNTHTRPKLQRIRAVMKPRTYRTGPASG